jgi:transcriptional regulator with XRE-family HTH domain
MPNTSLGKFGSLVRDRRRQLEMRQDDVARRVGVSTSYIANLESGARRPSEKLVIKLADVLGLDPRELFLYTVPKIASFLSNPKVSAEESLWDSFLTDQVLRDTYKITDQEMQILSRVALMGDVRSSQDFVFILRCIRRATRT